MSVKQFLMELVFKGNSTQAKAAANEVKQAVAGVSSETEKAAKATDKETASTKKNTEAKKRAVAAALEQAAAEKKARENALKAGTGVGPAGQGLPSPTPVVPASPSSHPQSELDDIRAQYVPLFAAQRTYQKELDAIAKAEKSGALTSQEVAAAQARVRGSYDHSIEAIKRTDAALQGNTRTMKLQAYEARILSYQVTDTWQSLMLGMPPMQILMQQGPQVIDVFGGIGNTLRHMRQFLTLARVGLGLLAGTAVAGVSSWNAYLKSTKEVETAHAGLGRGLATSSAQLEEAARAGASAAGISIKAARSMEVQFLRTGRIGAEHYDELIGLSKDFAATLGLEPEAAGAQLAEMFSDPAKAADTLYQKYGLIDAATMRYAQTLVSQNRAGDAQAVLLDALPDKLANAEEGMHALERAMQGIKRGASGLWDGIGAGIDGIFDGPTLDEQLAIAQRHLKTVNRRGGGGGGGEYAQNAQAQYTAIRGGLNYEGLNAYYENDRREAELRGKNALTLAEGSGATSRMRQEEALRNQIAALQAGVGAPGHDSFQQAEIQQALEAKKRVLEALIAPQQRLNELDRLDAQIAAERNPVLRAEMEARRARLQMADQEVSQAEIDTAASRARLKVIEQTIASSQTQVSDMRAETEIRIRLTEQVAAGIIKSEDVNRLLQEELTLRPLVAAAAAAEGEEKTRLTEIVDQMRQAYEDQAAADKTADRTSKLRDYLKTQQESMAQLRLEQSLIGQSEAIRERTLALFEAEKKIRELKLSGKQADQIREEAAQMADLRLEVDRLADAWDRVQSAAESAIDGPIDALLDGDLSGALDSFADEITGMFADLAIKNPLKNALLGTNYGTLSDLGGLGGIWDRLTGKVPAIDPAAAAAKAAAQSVATMQVTAANVTISTMGGLGLGGLGNAANINGLPGSSDVQSQIAAFFSGKGLKSHQIAGIMGNISAESAFNPAAVGDGGTSFGLFQHHAGRGQSLLNAVGGMGGLGDVQAQLEHVWEELLTSENGVLKKLMASTNVQEATSAFVGFERPAGWSAANPMGAQNWSGRLGAAEAAMTKFATTTDVATQGLGTLGGGFDVFGQALSQIGSGAGGGDLLSGLIGSLLGAIGIPGFATGGETGGSDPKKVAGLVHQKEFVFDAAATARIGVGNLEAIRRGTMRGYASGGYVSSARAYPFLTQGGGNGGGANVVQLQPVLINNTSAPMQMEVEETTDSRGQRQQKYVLSDAVATGMTGGAAKRQMQAMYGARQKGIGRG